VNQCSQKPTRFQLEADAYEALRKQVLHRDGWRCQRCGTMSNLEAHHQQFRSRGGDDLEQNLITLCSACHSLVHRARTR
jgi:5-methylcytosine-specific restriction endonuclease McrA